MTHINQRRDTAANWTSANPVLQLGEVGWERDTLKAKLGDGVTAWNLLAYAIQPYDLDDYALLESPVFTGTPSAPTPTAGDDSTAIATTAFVKDQGYVGADSPVLTGNPTAPTPVTTDNDTSIATTEFVKAVLAAAGYITADSPVLTGDPTAPTPATADNDTSIATTAFVKAVLASVGISKIKFGIDTVDIATQNVTATKTVTFGSAFASTPTVLAVVRTTTAVGTRFVGVSGESTTGFTVTGINTASSTDINFAWVALL
jgi:hypothetical protein